MIDEELEWFTTEDGIHVPMKKGQTKEEALQDFFSNPEKDLPKKREYKKYWLRNEDMKWESYTGVSKKEYERGISLGREGHVNDYDELKDGKIPENIEEGMQNSLNNITKIKSKGDFFTQLRHNMSINGVYNAGSYQTILDAFSDEISEKYNQLIQPQIDAINNIDIDNSADYFSQAVNNLKINENFKNNLNNMFDGCKNEDCKIMAAVCVSQFGTTFTENEAYNNFWDKVTNTCYMPSINNINIKSDDMDTDTLFHELNHCIYDKYDIKHSGLKEIIKQEFNKNVLKRIEDEFGLQAYVNKNHPEKANAFKEALDEEKQLRIKKDKAYRAMKEAENLSYEEYRNALSEYNFAKLEYDSKKYTIDKIRSQVSRNFALKYGNLADMIEATGINMVESTKLGFGHGSSYWKSDDTLQSNEFFAEMTAMIATGDNEQYELIKKFIPKSVAKFEEIYNNIIKNKGDALKL